MVNVDPSKALDQRGRGAAGPGRSTASEGATPAKKKVKKVKSSNGKEHPEGTEAFDGALLAEAG